MVESDTKDLTFQVVFEDGGFYVINSHDFQTINEYPLEVIGNTHENIELMEESE